MTLTANELADAILHRALRRMEGASVPRSVAIDRLLTMAAALSTLEDGAAHTAHEFRKAADRIAAGALSKFEPVSH